MVASPHAMIDADALPDTSASSFTVPSSVDEAGMRLGLAPALTPEGLTSSPSFFHGFLTQPQVYARGLLTLAEITQTRYFHYTPEHLRDPVFTAHGDRLRAEVFSACNSVVARLDLDASAVDGGEIGFGTTNVDLGESMKAALVQILSADLMHLDVGVDAVTVSTLDHSRTERRVAMPPRWPSAFGNVAAQHSHFTLRAQYDAPTTRRILGLIPTSYRSDKEDQWISLHGRVPRVSDEPEPGAVRIPHIHRLAAVRRLLVHLRGMEVYAPEEPGRGVVVEFALTAGRLSLGLTERAWRGYSGEGALLTSLTAPQASADADLVNAMLAFEPRIDVPTLSRGAHLSERRILDALAVLAASGRVGWDLSLQAYFHRELPHDPARVTKDHPRVRSARTLAGRGAVHALGDGRYWVLSTDQESPRPGTTTPPAELLTERGTSPGGAALTGEEFGYLVRLVGPGDDSCECLWIRREGIWRGPCSHLLAAHLVAGDLQYQLAPAAESEDDNEEAGRR